MIQSCLGCEHYTHLPPSCDKIKDRSKVSYGLACIFYKETLHLCSNCRYYSIVVSTETNPKWMCNKDKKELTKTYWCCDDYEEVKR